MRNERDKNWQELRQRAIERLHARHGHLADMAMVDIETLVHELEIAQAELEVQNEELRRAELALAGALDRYRDLYDRAPVAYITLDADRVITQANHSAERLFAREWDELEGRSLLDLVRKTNRQSLDIALRSAAHTGVIQGAEFQIERTTAPGAFRWVHAEAAWLGTQGDQRGFRVMLVDITTRVQTEAELSRERESALTNLREAVEARARAEAITAALRTSEERFRLASDAGGTLVYEIDLTGSQPVIVHGLERVTGFDPNEFPLTLEWWNSLVHRGDASAHRDSQRLARDGAYFSVYRLRHRTENWILVEDTGQVIQNEKGEPVRLVGAIVDVTARRAAEGALRDANRRKDEFLATLAHELRNPLAPIRNAVQILRDDKHDSDQARWARDVIDRQTRQMARLVDDLLDVSRITRGKIELRRQRVDACSLVEDAIEATRPLIEQAGDVLSVEVSDTPVMIDADPIRVTQILMNLLNNAAKFTRHGGCIWLSVARENGQAVFRVRDNGIGIHADLLPHVFDMFMQGERSLEHSQGGLGIGLTLVQQLAEMHSGSVEARSEGTGRGSEFVVRLPGVPEVDAVEQASAGKRVPRASNAAGRRVLVVDDNQDSAESMAMFLRMTGYEVNTAHDGIAALEAANEMRPDVVMLDIGLPSLNGYDVARRIRARRGKDVLLIAMTGWGQEEDRRRAAESGFDHHLTKPVDFDRLQSLLGGASAA